jgi:hypothetical protein
VKPGVNVHADGLSTNNRDIPNVPDPSGPVVPIIPIQNDRESTGRVGEVDKLIEAGDVKQEKFDAGEDDDPIYIFSSSDGENQAGSSTQKNRKYRVVKKKKKMVEGGLFPVEFVIKHKKVRDMVFYKVKWEGYPYNKCTWEPRTNFDDFEPIEKYYIQKFDP